MFAVMVGGRTTGMVGGRCYPHLLRLPATLSCYDQRVLVDERYEWW